MNIPFPASSKPKKEIKMRTNTTNPRLRRLIKKLKKKEGVWKALAEELDKTNKNRAEVNLYKINKELEEDEVGLVPGKVLSYGNIDHKVKIGALNYSKKAKEKIKGEAQKIEEVLEESPEKEKIKIIK